MCECREVGLGSRSWRAQLCEQKVELEREVELVLVAGEPSCVSMQGGGAGFL